MKFEPEHFHFSQTHEQNFLAYTLMRMAGAQLTRENFFKQVFIPADQKLENEILQIFTDLPGTKEMHANIGFDGGRDYETVLTEIQLAYEFYYDKWSSAHSKLEDIVSIALKQTLENGSLLRSPYWEVYGFNDGDRRVLAYGHHIGIISRIAEQHFVRLGVRTELLANIYVPEARVQIALRPSRDFNFASIRKSF